MQDFNQIALELIRGSWHYDAEHAVIKKELGCTQSFFDKHLLIDDGYMIPELKTSIITTLGSEILADSVGPYGDDDFFCGVEMEDTTYYFIEIHQFDADKVKALQNKFNNIKLRV